MGDDGVHWDYSKNSSNMFAGGSMLVSSKVGLAVGILTVVVATVCGWWWHYVLLRESKAGTSSNKNAPLPPGSLGLPLLGETLEFLRLTQADKSVEFLNPLVAKHARCIFTSFFGPDGLQCFVPKMEKMVRDHFVKFWEGKDEIMVFAIIKQFAFALVADLFFSITEGPQFWLLEHDLFTLSLGIGLPPIDFPGTSYHNAKLSCDCILSTLDTIICQRCKDMEEGKVSSHHDLLSIMISTVDQDQLATNEDIKDNILLFLFAGHDTSSKRK
ncbi:hypothetical protein CY35_17G018200 [Sphagnum magellanicum]|nr:hypothetical protein CY35_17G018200 [Sphagnum magellanicum]